jgi:O-antigen/teichoic acid export membrane protein
LSLSAAEVVSAVLLALISLYLVRTLSTHEYVRAAFGMNINQLFVTVAGTPMA